MCKEYNRKTIQSEDNNALILTLRVSRFTPITSNFENQEHVNKSFQIHNPQIKYINENIKKTHSQKQSTIILFQN